MDQERTKAVRAKRPEHGPVGPCHSEHGLESPCHGGFTLIELLVVIAIIAILVALLLYA